MCFLPARYGDECPKAVLFGQNENYAFAPPRSGVYYESFGGASESLSEVRMSIRPKAFDFGSGES